jgi:hypothetical protein
MHFYMLYFVPPFSFLCLVGLILIHYVVWQISKDFLSLKWITESIKCGHVCPRRIHEDVIRRRRWSPWPKNFSSITTPQQFTAHYHEIYGGGRGNIYIYTYTYTIPLSTIFGSKNFCLVPKLKSALKEQTLQDIKHFTQKKWQPRWRLTRISSSIRYSETWLMGL